MGIDCVNQRAYVPLDDFNANTHGQVAVLDLSVDPDLSDPRIKIVDIGLTELPRAAAADPQANLALILTDNVLDTGHLLLINGKDFTIKTLSLPDGSRPSESDGVVFNQLTGTATVSMSDSLVGCVVAHTCTGVAPFDLASQKFGPLVNLDNPVDSFGMDPATGVVLATSDPVTPLLYAVNNTNPQQCILGDENIEFLDADPDALGADPATNIWVVGNYDISTLTAVNLNGSSFSPAPGCQLQEETPPNSVNFDTGATGGMPGVSINPVTHQALVTGTASNEVALVSLPTAPVPQLTAGMINGVVTTLPRGPLGDQFVAASFPYATNVDGCHNLGYVLDANREFVVQIDLGLMQSSPAKISTALPAGKCAGTSSTTFKCDNGNGVKFFPLPVVK
jgi:hypothetical protein